jgi:hypothetical protein
MPPGNQLATLIYAEVDVLMRDLQEAVDDLERYWRRMRRSPGFPVVVDSNVLLECQRLDSVAWPVELGEARVMVPLRVIEEVDAKKYGDSKRLRGLARELLPWIDSLFPGGEPGPVRIKGSPLRLGVTRAVGGRRKPCCGPFRAPLVALASCSPPVRCRDCRCPQVAEPRATRQAAASVCGAPRKPPSLQGIRPLDPGFGSALWR